MTLVFKHRDAMAEVLMQLAKDLGLSALSEVQHLFWYSVL